MKKIAIIIILLLLPSFLNAAEYDYDLGLGNSDIFFSQPMDHLVEKQPVRIYAKIKNYGEFDVFASIIFFSGVNLIGETQLVSVRAGGLADEVFVDWIVPSGTFNIMAEIKNPDPADENLTNNRALTALITPLLDDDGDGIPNIEDDDIDNDGVSNEQENENGTDPNDSDSDNDGVGDAQDFYPLDPSKSTEILVEQALLDEPVNVIEPEEVGDVVSEDNSVASTNNNTAVVEVVEDDKELEKEFETEAYQQLQTMSEFKLINHAEILVEQNGWGKYDFEFKTNVENFDKEALIYEWDFGDGKKTKVNGEHNFKRAGTYFVKLKVLGPFGNTITDVVTINVPFWAIENYAMWGGGVFLLLALIVLIFSGRRQRPQLK